MSARVRFRLLRSLDRRKRNALDGRLWRGSDRCGARFGRKQLDNAIDERSATLFVQIEGGCADLACEDFLKAVAQPQNERGDLRRAAVVTNLDAQDEVYLNGDPYAPAHLLGDAASPTVAVQVGLLTVYDMLKAADRGMVITDVALLEKQGGRSGHWTRDGAAPAA